MDREEAVGKAKTDMLDYEIIESLSKLFKVFGDPTRIKILWALNVHELCVLDICESTGDDKICGITSACYIKRSQVGKSQKRR